MPRQTLFTNPKFARLVHILGEPKPHVLGYLEFLWRVGYECGDPILGDQLNVAILAEYPGDPAKLCEALLTCGGPGRAGFIEVVPDEEGLYQIHDLYDHCPKHVKERAEKERERNQDKVCEHCGKTYHSTEAHAKYCSPACRVADCRARAAVTECNGALRYSNADHRYSNADVTDANAPQHTAHSTQNTHTASAHSAADADALKNQEKAAIAALKSVDFRPKRQAQHYAERDPALVLVVVRWVKQQTWCKAPAAVVRQCLDDPDGNDFHRDATGHWQPPPEQSGAAGKSRQEIIAEMDKRR